MVKSVASPPRTIMELYNSLPEGTLAELIDGVIYMSPSPIFNHQSTLQKIFRRLAEKISDKGLGEVVVAPFDVYLDEKRNAVQPDIIVVLKENYSILDREGKIHGVPDMLFEILSDGNKTHDTVRKKKLYEKFGVKEYWTIDPETQEATGYILNKGKYIELSKKKGSVQSKLLGTTFKF
jgi:Uma2 family endonuclease